MAKPKYFSLNRRAQALIRPDPCWPQFTALILAGLLVLLLSGCTSRDEEAKNQGSSRHPASLSPGDPRDFKVLVFNIEYGGNEVTDRVIKALDADVVGVLESYNRLPEIARNSGYPFHNLGLQMLSKYPIHEPSGADGLYALIEVQPGYVVAFFNAHLDYVQYGPPLLSEGIPVETLITSENEVRTSSMRKLMPHMQKLAGAGYPVFLTGDFNQPSSLDYAQETVGTRKGITQPVPWPVSEALLGIGMRDTFREMHPDPLRRPGLTQGEYRIDYIYAGGPVTTLESVLVGETGSTDVDLAFDPWTSDHRAVLSSFRVTPVKLPVTVALDRRMLTTGEYLGVRYNAPDKSQMSIVIVSEDDDTSSAIEFVCPDESGEVRFSTDSFDPGGYTVSLFDSRGDGLARNHFRVRSAGSQAVIEAGKPRYKAGEPIHVTWRDGPANRWDWVAVYRQSDAELTEDGLLIWAYTGGHDSGVLPPQVSGQLTLGEQSQGSPWPLPAGAYRIYYLLTDQYQPAAYVDVTIE